MSLKNLFNMAKNLEVIEYIINIDLVADLTLLDELLQVSINLENILAYIFMVLLVSVNGRI